MNTIYWDKNECTKQLIAQNGRRIELKSESWKLIADS